MTRFMNYHRTREKAGTVMIFGKGIENMALASTSFSSARQPPRHIEIVRILHGRMNLEKHLTKNGTDIF